jgi:hypothetical protein
MAKPSRLILAKEIVALYFLRLVRNTQIRYEGFEATQRVAA